MKIKVSELTPRIDDVQISVSLTNVKFMADNINDGVLYFWLTPEQADDLCFKLGSMLQDLDIRKNHETLVFNQKPRV